MTKREERRMKKFAEAKKNEELIRLYWANFAEENGCELTDCKVIEEDLFGDGIPRCITVFKKN